MKILSQADVILAMGTRLNAFGTTPQYGIDFFPANARLIHNSINPLELGALRPIEVGLLGDCGEVARQLTEALQGRARAFDRNARLAAIRQEKLEWATKLRKSSMVDTAPIASRRALWEISRAVPDNVSVVANVGNVSGSANAYFASFDHHRRWFGAGSLGGIGLGFPTALGVKLARPDEPVLALCGDGAWSMTLQEVMTAVREKLNLVTIVLNNGVYGAERRNQFDFFEQRYFYTDLENPSFAEVAQCMGALGKRIDRAQDLGEALRNAFEQDRPTVLEIELDPSALNEPYRRGALKRPNRVPPMYAR